MSDEAKKQENESIQHIDEGINKSFPTTNTVTPMPVVKPPKAPENSNTTNNNSSKK